VLRDNYVTLVKKWQAVQIRAKRMGNNADAYTEAATQAETARLQQINRLLRKVNKLGLDATSRTRNARPPESS
jgi:DNA anti-recombination protein RmuC